MFFLSRWIQKWHEERQLTKETEAREAKRRLQQEKRDDQQAQALLLTLNELQRTMDPLMAVQVYNNRFCPIISRLPEELLLCILDFLRDDVVALHCLRIVSRTFFRLLNRQSDVCKGTRHRDCPISITGEASFLPYVLRLQFRRLLQRDGRCDNCKRWNDAYGHQLFDDCKFQQDSRQFPDGGINALLCRRLYCYACHSLHDVCQFSSAYQQAKEHQPERRCLGQQGSVQLCEHVQIAWAGIKAHIDNWRQHRRGGGWQACLDSFNIECHHASHDTRCRALEAPTWPRAHLRTSTWDPDIVVLNLEWIPHNRIDALALTVDGRIPASELRALFQRLRCLGPADILYPPCRPGALPEMACFSPSSRVGPFIYYKTGEDNKAGPPPASFLPHPLVPWLLFYHGYGRGRNGKKLEITPHYLRGRGSRRQLPQCFVVKYEKDVMVCKTAAMTDPAVKIIPTDHWLHAMDTRTYPYPQASHIRPQCRDETCTNYYRRQRNYYLCPAWPRADDLWIS